MFVSDFIHFVTGLLAYTEYYYNEWRYTKRRNSEDFKKKWDTTNLEVGMCIGEQGETSAVDIFNVCRTPLPREQCKFTVLLPFFSVQISDVTEDLIAVLGLCMTDIVYVLSSSGLLRVCECGATDMFMG